MKYCLISWFVCLSVMSCSSPTKDAGQATPSVTLSNTISKIQSVSPNRSLKVGQVISAIGFGSCMDQNYPQTIWSPLKGESLDLFIGLGDLVYASQPNDKPMAKAYLKQIENAELQEFRAQVPWIGVWDDHDFGVNDGGGDHPEFQEAKDLLLAFLPNSAKVIPPEQKGLYHSIVLGNKPKTLQVLVLDTRTYRSPLTPHRGGDPLVRYQENLDSKATILGEDQWKWLETEIQKPANFRILVSSIQILSEKHGFEKWANFPHERKRLLNLIEKNKIKNMVLLSGDRHFSEISKIRLNKKHTLVEITNSSLNKSSQLVNEVNPLRLGKPYYQANYGVLNIDYMKRTAIYNLKDAKGTQLDEYRIRF